MSFEYFIETKELDLLTKWVRLDNDSYEISVEKHLDTYKSGIVFIKSCYNAEPETILKWLKMCDIFLQEKDDSIVVTCEVGFALPIIITLTKLEISQLDRIERRLKALSDEAYVQYKIIVQNEKLYISHQEVRDFLVNKFKDDDVWKLFKPSLTSENIVALKILFQSENYNLEKVPMYIGTNTLVYLHPYTVIEGLLCYKKDMKMGKYFAIMNHFKSYGGTAWSYDISDHAVAAYPSLYSHSLNLYYYGGKIYHHDKTMNSHIRNEEEGVMCMYTLRKVDLFDFKAYQNLWLNKDFKQPYTFDKTDGDYYYFY